LVQEGYLLGAEVIKSSATKKNQSFSFDQLKLVLKYENDGSPKVKHLKRISRPGLRAYVGFSDLPRVLNGLGIAIISTSSGLMTNKEARAKKVGGEVLCEIY
jgi:small subunit ribosomal protein S8